MIGALQDLQSLLIDTTDAPLTDAVDLAQQREAQGSDLTDTSDLVQLLQAQHGDLAELEDGIQQLVVDHLLAQHCERQAL